MYSPLMKDLAVLGYDIDGMIAEMRARPESVYDPDLDYTFHDLYQGLADEEIAKGEADGFIAYCVSHVGKWSLDNVA